MKILILDDGIAGNSRQAVGIADSVVGSEKKVISVKLKGPCYKIPGRKGNYPVASKIIAAACCLRLWTIARFLLKIFSTENIIKQIDGSFDIIVSAGSLLAPVNCIISRMLKAKSVIIMAPHFIDLTLFDLIFLHYDDILSHPSWKKKKNVVYTIGVPNRINDCLLKSEKKKLEQHIMLNPHVLKIGLLIGGNDQNYKLSVDLVKNILKELIGLDNINLLLSTSRRTPANVMRYLEKQSESQKLIVYSEFPAQQGENHYFGILGTADVIIVTEDSVNMITESMTTGKPVLILQVQRKNRRELIFDRMFRSFTEKGYVEYLSVNEIDKLSSLLKRMVNKKYKKLDETKKCAQKISEILT